MGEKREEHTNPQNARNRPFQFDLCLDKHFEFNCSPVNEKIYIFLWFWFLLLGFLTILVVFYRILIVFSPRIRVSKYKLINR